jgi:Flp pilus assembly pilin Flp
VAAATERGHNGSLSSLWEIARSEAGKNGFDAANGVIAVNAPPSSGPNSADLLAVEVILSEPTALFFAGAFLNGPVTIGTRAVAKPIVDNEFCLLALHPTLDRAVEFEGNADANFDCGVASNSSSDNALHLNGSARLTTTEVTTVGDYTATAGLDSATPPRPYSNPLRSPYADLAIPSFSGCAHTGLSVTTTRTLSPGVYCNGLSFESSARVTLNPGAYIVDRGSFYAAANSRITGRRVTIILTSSTGAGYGAIEIRGGAVLDVAAPTSGDWAGVLFFQDPRAPSTIVNSVAGNAAVELTGAIYAPSQEVRFSGNMSLSTGCLQMIGRKLTIIGAAQIPSNCAETGCGRWGGSGSRSSNDRPARRGAMSCAARPQSVRSLLRCREGASAVELALLTPLLLLLLVGVFDFGTAIRQKMQLNNAATAGAQYAVLDDRNAAGLQQAIANATALSGGDFTVATSRVCECLDGRSVTCSNADACGVGARRRFFLEISVSRPHETMFDYPGMSNPFPLTGRSRMQVE